MNALRDINSRASALGKTIVLSEGEDRRIVEAAVRARQEGIARIILVGDEDKVRALMGQQNADGLDGITIMDPRTSPHGERLAHDYFKMRQHKGVTPEKAAAALAEPLVFSAMLVRAGLADGTVGGAVATTADTVRAAIQVIGLKPAGKLISSFFLMLLQKPHHDPQGPVAFADCGLVVDPSAAEMAEIAGATAQSFQALTGQQPRVAMLSFSTLGSARHPNATKVVEATALVRQQFPDLMVDGELQFDTAFVPDIAQRKAPGSPVAGRANVFVFPNLDAGNMGYKIAQRIGGAEAIGPILQGLAKPANDLSRGCSAEDALNLIAVTAVQAGMEP
ncbi:MAG: phosphate acetyltransferase [Paracoccaceae bacterium]|nr:phosphate acetyltransferase [Paracoccaceae bacterium]MDH5529345.1 phosphate acetyltransferase [Paracoccaceae bacterium]